MSLEFDIKANLGNTVANLDKVQKELLETGKAAQKAAGDMPKLTRGLAGTNTALTNFARLIQDAPYGIQGMANNFDPLLLSLQNLGREARQNGTSALKELGKALIGPAGIAIAVSAVTSLLVKYGDQILAAIDTTAGYRDAIEEASSGAADSAIKVNILTEALKSGTLSASEQKKAQSELIKINPQFKGAFDGGAISVGKLDAALESTNKRLLEQIKISAATNILQKELEKLAATVASGGELSMFQKVVAGVKGALTDPISPSKGGAIAAAVKAAENLTEAQNKIKAFGERIKEVFGALDISFSSYVTNYEVGAEKQKKKIKEVAHEFEKLSEIQLKSQFDPTKFGNIPTQAPTEGNLAQTTEQIVANTERLKFLIKSVNYDKQVAQAEKLRGILDNGINGAVDQFFNALANNQNPFDALIQSLKRLIVELGVAVLKAFALKAITASIGGVGGGGASAGLLSGIGGFATGGFVSQPTLATIAENGPEFVLRPDQLGAIMNMGGGGGLQQVGVTITGEQLYILLQRTSSRKSRNF
jgi:hypothetical protein